MDALSLHYSQLLGLGSAWLVDDVDLSLQDQRVVIRLRHDSSVPVSCPECGQACKLHDHAPERRWRHLDTMQFETVLSARVPRSKCLECGVKTIAVPWASPHSRFTLMFEAFVIRLLLAAGSIDQASKLLRLNWSSVQNIMSRGVKRGMLRREQAETIRYVGMDEKSFGRGQDYISTMTDIEGRRILEVAPGRDQQAANALWSSLSPAQKQQVEAVCIDMWQAFENSAAEQVPEADIVHDRFHISQYLNQAIDQVRRQEHKHLLQQGDETLKGTRQLWLYHPENLTIERWQTFAELKQAQLKTARAWAIREQLRWFWEYRYAKSAGKFFQQWYGWASRSRLQPIIKVAKMLKRRLKHILTWFKHPISNAAAEGFNSRIQSIKSAARGFRNFDNYRTRILFFCGKLDMLPTKL